MADDRELLERLGRTVERLVDFYRRVGGATVPVNAKWTARDALVHVVFWHESFARNVGDLARGVKPAPLKGTYAELGRRAATEAEGRSIEELLTRLMSAQSVIEESILDPRVVSIPYKIGSRPYSPAEHLSIVNEHVGGHLSKVESAYALHESGT
jgi:hypothetical protein